MAIPLRDGQGTLRVILVGALTLSRLQATLSRQLPHAVQTALVAPPNVFLTRPDPR
jgi:hypothetical protein